MPAYILFVCTGNTCRSPMAAGIFNAMAERAGIQTRAKSCGVAVSEGSPATGEAIKAAAELGADISGHRAANISEELAANAKRIYAMTQAHKRLLTERFCIPESKIVVLDIPDPFGRGIEEYRKTAYKIKEAIGGVLAKEVDS